SKPRCYRSLRLLALLNRFRTGRAILSVWKFPSIETPGCRNTIHMAVRLYSGITEGMHISAQTGNTLMLDKLMCSDIPSFSLRAEDSVHIPVKPFIKIEIQ